MEILKNRLKKQKGHKSRRPQLDTKETQAFLNRPVKKVENLNQNLKKSYEKGFFNLPRFEHFKLLKSKRVHKETDSIESVDNQNDSDFQIEMPRSKKYRNGNQEFDQEAELKTKIKDSKKSTKGPLNTWIKPTETKQQSSKIDSEIKERQSKTNKNQSSSQQLSSSSSNSSSSTSSQEKRSQSIKTQCKAQKELENKEIIVAKQKTSNEKVPNNINTANVKLRKTGKTIVNQKSFPRRSHAINYPCKQKIDSQNSESYFAVSKKQQTKNIQNVTMRITNSYISDQRQSNQQKDIKLNTQLIVKQQLSVSSNESLSGQVQIPQKQTNQVSLTVQKVKPSSKYQRQQYGSNHTKSPTTSQTLTAQASNNHNKQNFTVKSKQQHQLIPRKSSLSLNSKVIVESFFVSVNNYINRIENTSQSQNQLKERIQLINQLFQHAPCCPHFSAQFRKKRIIQQFEEEDQSDRDNIKWQKTMGNDFDQIKDFTKMNNLAKKQNRIKIQDTSYDQNHVKGQVKSPVEILNNNKKQYHPYHNQPHINNSQLQHSLL